MSNTIDMDIVQELLDLCDEGDLSLIADLIKMFLADGPARIDQITTGLASGDLAAVERAAHSIKGSSGNLGAMNLMNVAEALQVSSQAEDLELSTKLGPQICDAYASAAAELRRLAARLGAAA